MAARDEDREQRIGRRSNRPPCGARARTSDAGGAAAIFSFLSGVVGDFSARLTAV